MDNNIRSIIQAIIIENSLNKMGVNQSKQLLGSKYDWKKLQSKRTDIEGHPCLVQDEFSLVMADCYEIAMHNHLDYHRKLMIRRNNIEDPCIVKVIDAQIKQKTIMECGNMDVVQVFTEAVPHRLGDIQLGDIQSMLVLQQFIRACQTLCQLAGNYFTFYPKMIGFMENGRIKVWLNENFGKLEIEQKALLRNQQDMIKTIMGAFGPKFTRKYDFLQSSNFIQAFCAIQTFLKSVNKAMVLAQIEAKLRKKQPFHNPTSSKKLSMSDKSIIGCKSKANLNHRSSIDRSFDHLNALSLVRIAQFKQNNNNNCKILNQGRNTKGLSATSPKLKKSPLNTSSTSIKISLADLSINSMPNYATNHLHKSVTQVAPRPFIRINYQNHLITPEKPHENHRINCKLTSFPKEESFVTAQKPTKSSLRPKCRQFSEIIQRSQQGQNTQSQTSEIVEQFYNQLGQDNFQNHQSSNLHISSPFNLIMTADPQWS